VLSLTIYAAMTHDGPLRICELDPSCGERFLELGDALLRGCLRGVEHVRCYVC